MKRPEIFLHYFHNTDYVGIFTSANERRPIQEIQLGTPENGLVIHLQIIIDNGVINDVRYRVYGNSAAIASASFVAHFLINKKVIEAKQLTYLMIMENLSLPLIDQYCAVMMKEAVVKVLSVK